MSPPEQAEVCIVGAGVAGAILAWQLARHGIKVLVLEAGPRHDPAKRHEYMKHRLYGIDPWARSDSAGDKYSLEGGRWKRVTGVGGSGLHWGANVNRLHDSDFELHSRYGIGWDWPIRYHDLEPYYAQAERLIGVAGEDAYPWTPWRSEKYPLPAFPLSYSDKILKVAFDRLAIPLYPTAVARNSIPYDGRPSCMSFAVCETCPIFAKWTPDLLINTAEESRKIILTPSTRVTRINCNKNGTAVESITAASAVNGKMVYKNYNAQLFLIAAHAIETTRLLLLSKSASHPHGLGNRHGYVGKYFTSHLSVIIAAELKQKTYPERIGFATSQSHLFYETSRRAGQNAFVLYPQNKSVNAPIDIAERELEKGIIWGNELKTRVQKEFGFTASIGALIEQLPHEDNQITLNQNLTDDFRLPVPKVNYSFKHERELRTIGKAGATIRQLFEVLDAKDVRSVRTVPVASHHMGTCRMGEDPKFSVVDQNLKVHGVDNLYLVGSSVFPTFGAVGPTLTIAALALRLADHVCGMLTPGIR